MKRKKTAAAIASAAAVTVSGLGVYLSNRIMYMKMKEASVIEERERSAGFYDEAEYSALPKEEVTIPSPGGYDLQAVFIKPHPGGPYVIFCHGVTENKMNSMKYMQLFLSKGYNAVIYDHRRHGDSGGKTTSYGFYEKIDLKAVVSALLEREGDQTVFGIHGESMGAVTTLLYAGTVEDRADFYIADCPFSDLSEQLAYLIGKKQRPGLASRLAVKLADAFILLRDRYTIRDVSPKEAVQHIKKPVLFIHSKNDGFIPSHMTETLYTLKEGPKNLYLAENGGHAQSYTANREEYSAKIDEFLNAFVQVSP
ncbi:alpha/beta hydrolase [Jeotgalibacillus sp. R-1-5s-1]|uniref:alpha/beta hydrolase n=1 Tax=Jeotgalibacillus sp. R-1-5s-1 TaxID=2555897 RepID=UPI00106B7465|nr:alpha/beta hydrolase [Jeotgalibacillus sp. R-1-5s-1]TFD92205.1 alpha/beta hydrolase [Jeotgalibacillus sp. R-1-5s-1]